MKTKAQLEDLLNSLTIEHNMLNLDFTEQSQKFAMDRKEFVDEFENLTNMYNSILNKLQNSEGLNGELRRKTDDNSITIKNLNAELTSIKSDSEADYAKVVKAHTILENYFYCKWGKLPEYLTPEYTNVENTTESFEERMFNEVISVLKDVDND